MSLIACSDGNGAGSDNKPVDDIDLLAGVQANIELTSSGFLDGNDMPGVYTCYGLDRSPDLSWRGVPENTVSLSMIFSGTDPDDADGPDKAHWVIYNLPGELSELPASISVTKESVLGGSQGRNDFRRGFGWHGPCPGRGVRQAGSYAFNLYALDTILEIDSGEKGVVRNDVIRAMEGHVIGHGQLQTKYCQSDAGSTGALSSGSKDRGSCPPLD